MTFREKARKRLPKEILPELFLFIGIFIWLIIFDVLSKYYAYANLEYGTRVTAIPYLFNFTLVFNNGAAWNILADQKWLLCTLSLVLGMVMLVCLIIYFAKLPRVLRIALLLATAGAFGNLVDRIGYWGQLGIYKNGVVDFIQFAFWPSFPVFNLADSYLVIGIATAIVYGIYHLIRYELLAKKNTPAEDEKKDDLINSLRQKESGRDPLPTDDNTHSGEEDNERESDNS